MPVAFGNIASEEQKTNDTCKTQTTEVILTAKEDLATPPTNDYNYMTEVVTPAEEDLPTPPTNEYNNTTEVITPSVEELPTPPTSDTITRRRS